MLFSLRILLTACCLFPAMAMANGCIDAPNRIYHDVKKYESTLSQRNFTWENMNWLQTQLGSPKVRKLDNNRIEYTWLCANDVDQTLLVITDDAGRFLYVKGQYNLDSGSGMFEATINQQNVPVKMIKTTVITNTTTAKTIPPAPPGIPSTPPVMPPDVAKPTPRPSSTSSANPAVCQNLTQQIGDDIKKYDLNINTQKTDLPWMNINWLQLQLGPASSTQVTEKLYTWNNYQLLQRATAIRQDFGIYPDKKRPTSPQEAIQILGKPNSIHEEILTKYVWRCTNDNSSLLEMYADDDNQLVYVTGKSCLGTCTDFSVQLRPVLGAEITLPAIKNDAPPPAPAVTTTFDQASINDYNQHFQTHFTTASDVQADMIQRMKQYYANLRNCTSGENQLAVNISGKPVFAIASIRGKQNDLCMIQEGTQIGSQRIIKICNYQPATLQFFQDPEAAAIATGNTNFSSANMDELQRAELTQCKIYINGVAV